MSKEHVKEAISNIMDKKLDTMRDNLSFALAEKTVQKLDERKQEIAKTVFEKK